ncbi:hypothetical protein C8R46DRAFT_1226301 [Mycena filopes]|nr:hypothetical protein C8R46DRAFT_1226301 [Mycena filopes]
MTSSYTDVAGVKRTHEVKGRCSACETTGTPTWRCGCSSSYHGKLLCNRCGLADRKGKLKNFSDQLRLQNRFALGFATAPSAGPPDYVIATFWLTDSASDSSTSHDPRDDGMAGSDDDELSAYPVDPGHAAFGVGMQDLLDSEV